MNIPTRQDSLVKSVDGVIRQSIYSKGEYHGNANMVKFLLENDPFITRSGEVRKIGEFYSYPSPSDW